MVATRRGLRVCSPNKKNIEQSSDVQATPSTSRRPTTRSVRAETSSQLGEELSDPQTPQSKKCTRASRLHSPKQPCTPTGSTHEADLSDLESCCSGTSDAQLPARRNRAAVESKNVRSVRRRALDKEESSSSVVSDAEAPATHVRRSRRLALTLSYAEDDLSEAESCSSLSAQKIDKRTKTTDNLKADDSATSQKVTQSQRKSTRSSAKPRPDESEPSDAESLASDVSGNARRRSARFRKKVSPTCLNFDQASESSATPSTRRTTRRTAAEKSCESEGFESGTEYTISVRRLTRSLTSKAAELDSDLTDGQSSHGTPCSSRAGSGSAKRRQTPLISTPLMKDLCIVLENSAEVKSLNDSMLDSTVVAEDADCTLKEEDVSEEKQKAGVMSNEVLMGDEEEEKVPVVEAALTSTNQQSELSLENKEEDSSTVEKMEEETGPSASGEVLQDERENVSTTREYLEVEQGKLEDAKATQDVIMESIKEDVSERMSEEATAPIDEVTPMDTKPAQETSNVTLVESREDEDDMGEKQEPSTKPEETMTTASVDEQVTPKKSQSQYVKTRRKAKIISVMDRIEDEDDTREKQGPSTKPEETMTTASVDEQVTPKKSQSQYVKTRRKAKIISVMDRIEDEDDTREKQGPSTKPEEMMTASVDEQVTSEKSQSQDVIPSMKAEMISLMDSNEDEDDMGEKQGPSRKPEEMMTAQPVDEQVIPEKSQSQDVKPTRMTKIISLMDSSEDEDDDDNDILHKDEEDTEDKRGRYKKAKNVEESVEGLFVVDTRPGEEVDEDYYTERLTREEVFGDEEDEEEFVDEEADDDADVDCGESALLLSSRNPLLKEMSSRIDPGINMRQLGGLYITFDGSKSKTVSSSVNEQKEKTDLDEVMKNSVMVSDFEKKDSVPPYSESKQALKQQRRVERGKTTGDSWFNMKAPELTKELTGDLKLLKMRASMDPKRFYKKNDRDGFPKYFQVATVVDNPVDFYHSRIPKKQRKRTMVEELLADAEFRSNNKKKYHSIVAEKAAQASGKHKYKTNKFHKKSGKVSK
ncbi:deoxynucleotidyltransferase terminal-interacting protein 2 [Corythoichthys intestinalis]|uniref:deoxynucleotidyltransferase terminal-interacting protein 2 n=1 Tax=Corythoichthys intestinalis TaxID=161448 RepID=UPI0025A62D7C|nr:deoxynucleotidyltransferase terminal-interacting protein 2 [Corythoichthys intestinalis]